MIRLELHYINVMATPQMAEATLGPTFIRVPARFNGVSYFALTGHEHQWGTDVYIEVAESEGSAGTPVYDIPNFLWDEPARTPPSQASPLSSREMLKS